jgi:hypothetical protein
MRLKMLLLLGAALIVGILLAAFAYVMVGLPADIVGPRKHLPVPQWLRLKNDVRTTGVQVIGGVILGIGAVFTAWNAFRAWRVTREGQTAEAFTKAVELLTSKKVDSRLGGIYALGRIAEGSPHDRIAVSQILATFLRRRSPWPSGVRATAFAPTDVQAAATVLTRQKSSHEEGARLDLSNIDLRLVRLVGAKLRGANLSDTNLAGAFLDKADLRGANLTKADLTGARMSRARLTDANLTAALLIGTYVDRTKLRGAIFDEAKVAGANFTRARGARLETAIGRPTRPR